MVTLNKIYTKTGDEGLTSLGDGSRISKNNISLLEHLTDTLV